MLKKSTERLKEEAYNCSFILRRPPHVLDSMSFQKIMENNSQNCRWPPEGAVLFLTVNSEVGRVCYSAAL